MYGSAQGVRTHLYALGPGLLSQRSGRQYPEGQPVRIDVVDHSDASIVFSEISAAVARAVTARAVYALDWAV